MKEAAFLAKLKRQGKLASVEPSEEIKLAYIAKSESNLISAKILLENGRLEEAVYLAYYSMYHMLTSLLFRTGIKCENHAVSISLLKEVFGLDNSGILKAKSERVDKQYYVDFVLAGSEVEDTIKAAEDFNRMMLDFISKLNAGTIDTYRKRFAAMLDGL
ncbi:MAG: HEPN domain-containing protein [Candidatus Aenigmarchaeota archaeon]|nr:HEPN domain-containing protein [Candidatus Aenigmarchaeota archaeon]